MTDRCVALEWGLTGEGSKDYVQCDGSKAERCILEGIMLAVEVHLCLEHQKYFASQPTGWSQVKVFDAESRRRIEFLPYRGKLLTAEKQQ